MGGRIAYVSKESLASSVSEDLLAEGSHEYRHATNFPIKEELPGWFARGKEGFRRPEVEVKVEITILHVQGNEQYDENNEVADALGGDLPARDGHNDGGIKRQLSTPSECAPRYFKSMDGRYIPSEQALGEDMVNQAIGFKVNDMHVG